MNDDVSDDFSRPEGDALASPDWAESYMAIGSMITNGNSIRWVAPTSAGEMSACGLRCTTCGHTVTMKSGDVIHRGDPRLCVHMGGPSEPPILPPSWWKYRDHCMCGWCTRVRNGAEIK